MQTNLDVVMWIALLAALALPLVASILLFRVPLRGNNPDDSDFPRKG